VELARTTANACYCSYLCSYDPRSRPNRR